MLVEQKLCQGVWVKFEQADKACLEYFLNRHQQVSLLCDYAYLVHSHIEDTDNSS